MTEFKPYPSLPLSAHLTLMRATMAAQNVTDVPQSAMWLSTLETCGRLILYVRLANLPEILLSLRELTLTIPTLLHYHAVPDDHEVLTLDVVASVLKGHTEYKLHGEPPLTALKEHYSHTNILSEITQRLLKIASAPLSSGSIRTHPRLVPQIRELLGWIGMFATAYRFIPLHVIQIPLEYREAFAHLPTFEKLQEMRQSWPHN